MIMKLRNPPRVPTLRFLVFCNVLHNYNNVHVWAILMIMFIPIRNTVNLEDFAFRMINFLLKIFHRNDPVPH